MTQPGLESYRPESAGPTALFLDTSGLFPRFHTDARRHQEVSALFAGIGSGEFPYRPLVTNTDVLDELATLLVSKGTHENAAWAVRTLTESDAISIGYETDERVSAATEAILAYDDREISFTDHYCCVEMSDRAISHVLAFDGDYETRGFTVVPRQ
jgi:predicted nucleic acid-binding protein